MRNKLSKKYCNIDAKQINEYLNKNNIQIDQEKEFKLTILSDLIEDYISVPLKLGRVKYYQTTLE